MLFSLFEAVSTGQKIGIFNFGMCGINGYIGFSEREKAAAAVGRMNAALQHRGPDHLDAWTGTHAVLGHARLSIIDLSSNAHQPFVSSCGRYVMVFNGEIYNYQQLKRELDRQYPGIVYTTSSDTEVLLNLYKYQGISCLEKLNGMFAFAIWDKQEEQLIMGRDRLGKKPFYYYHNGSTFVFSSEIRALMQSDLVPRQLNTAVLPDYVQYQTVHAPQTLIKNVYLLMPGAYAIFGKGRFTTQVYWKPAIGTRQQMSEQEYQEEIRQVFSDAVSLRMVADVEVGAFLSGGIDSSAVVAQMSRLSSKPISTFSVIFGEEDFSEEIFSSAIAKKYQTRHHPIRINAHDFLHDLPSVLKAVDFPGGDGPNTYVVAQATRKTGIKVALTGLGGDELFAGYPVFKQLHSFHRKKWLKGTPRFVRVLAGHALQAVKGGTVGQKYKRILTQGKMTDAGFYSLSRQLFDRSYVKVLLTQNGHDTYPVDEIAGQVFNSTTDHILSETSLAEINTYLQNVLLRDTDQMTMAHALEVRAPFLDHRLVELALSVPDQIKYPHTPKQLFVKAMGDMLPPEVIHRKKMGFVFPWEHWLRNELQGYCELRIQRLSERGYFNKEELADLWERFVKKDEVVPWSRVWHLVALEEWMQNNGIE